MPRIPLIITDKNVFPDEQPEDKQPKDGNVQGDLYGETTDFYRGLEGQFNEPDGTFSLYDPNNPDRMYMDMVEQEAIELSSPPLYLYPLDIENIVVDEVYGEVRHGTDRKYTNPIKLFGNYENPAPIQELQKYGLNEPEELDIWFNYHYLLRMLNRRIQIGEVIRTYDNKLWEVMSSIIMHEALWQNIHNSIRVKRLITENINLPDLGDISISPNNIYSDNYREVENVTPEPPPEQKFEEDDVYK